MILGYDATTLDSRMSGVGWYTAHLLAGLAEQVAEGELERILLLSNRPVPQQPCERVTSYDRRRMRPRWVWMQLRLPGILRELRPDLVHYTNYLAPASSDIPYVVSVHDMTLALMPELHTLRKQLLTTRLLPRIARGARLVLTPSRSTRDDAVRLLGLDPGRVRVIPYAAGAQFRPEPLPGEPALMRGFDAPYFLFVGTLEPRKNLVRALRAFARVASALPDHHFVLAGPLGWHAREILQETQRPELRGRVHLLGYVSERELPEWYRGATALVYPSLYEGFGLPVVEAMASGTPVLTSRNSSLEEIAAGAARLVDPTDVVALAAELEALAGDAGLRSELRRLGLQRVRGLSWRRTARETAAAYREAVEGAARARRAPAPARDADAAVIRSIAYAALFEAPLSVDALARLLMDVRLERGALEARLAAPPLRQRLERHGDWLVPRGRGDWLALAEHRRAHSRALLERHARALRALARLPWVRLVALSGACAHDNASDDDVDVFLVVERGRAWAVTLAVTLLSKLAGLRRSLCVNYVLDTSALALPERDLFTAAEIAGMRPLWGRAGYRAFVAANPWVGERFPNFMAHHIEASEQVPEAPPAGALERLLELGFGGALERASRWALGAWLRRRLGDGPGVELRPWRLKLHVVDRRQQLNQAFAAAVRRLEQPPAQAPGAGARAAADAAAATAGARS